MNQTMNQTGCATVPLTHLRAVFVALAVVLAVATGGRAQTPPPAPPSPAPAPAPKPEADNPLLRKLDANGDGVIDDAERRAMR